MLSMWRGKAMRPSNAQAAPPLSSSPPPRAEAVAARANNRQVTLPNGLTIEHASTADEALFLYREHWCERVYLRRGVALREGDVVVDVGANIGLFAMAAAEECGPTGRVICFEPIPAAAAACRANVAAHAAWRAARGLPRPAPVTVVEAAAGDGSAREAEFTVYANAAGWASMEPNDDETLANMEAYLAARLRAISGSGGGGDGDGDGGDGSSKEGLDVAAGVLERVLLAAAAALFSWPLARGPVRAAARAYVRWGLLRARRRVRCRVVALSDALREEHPEGRIALLKIDVERAELAVLRGVDGATWARVGQVALEVHDHGAGAGAGAGASGLGSSSEDGGSGSGSGGGGGGRPGRLEEVCALLRSAGGFSSVVHDQDPLLQGTTLHNVYAVK